MIDNNDNDKLQAAHGAHSRKQPHKRNLLLKLIIFMVWVAGIGLLISLVSCKTANAKQIATNDNSGYYIDLSKLNSDLPSRKPLAFFVPDSSAASQAITMPSSTALRAHLSASRGQTIILIASHLLTDYDGLTLQNKIAVRRICRAVTVKTESKTRHPILLPYSVALTQKLTGAIHHG